MRSAAALLLVPLLTLAACSGPDVYEGEILRGGEEVQVEVHSYVDDVDVEEVYGRMESSRTSGQFLIENESSEPLRLRCITEWRDHDGFRLRHAAGESPISFLVLQPGETRTLSFLSPSRRAVKLVARIENLASEED